MARPSNKAKIPEAAARVVVRRGITGVTISEVAAELGLSTGGVRYHFPTKESLLYAMVERLAELTEERIDSNRKGDDGPGSWTRGFVNAASVVGGDEGKKTQNLSIALLAAAAADTKLLGPMSDRQPTWRQHLNSDGIDPAIAHIVRLTADGLWINDVLNHPVVSDSERKAVMERLDDLTRTGDNTQDHASSSPRDTTPSKKPRDNS